MELSGPSKGLHLTAGLGVIVEKEGEKSPRTQTWPTAPEGPEPGFIIIPTSCCRSLISWIPGWAGPCGDTQGCSIENLKWSLRSWAWAMRIRQVERRRREPAQHRMWTEPRPTTHQPGWGWRSSCCRLGTMAMGGHTSLWGLPCRLVPLRLRRFYSSPDRVRREPWVMLVGSRL